MQFYDNSFLFIPTFFIFTVGMLILSIYIKNILVSIFLSSIKSTMFFIYFYYLFDGTYTFLDDWTYLNKATSYIEGNYDFFSLILHPLILENIFGSGHFLYQLYNVLAFKLFGNYYYSPVALNIVLTFITSYFVFKLSTFIGFTRKLSSIIAIFYLLHWDILAWSTIANLKDILVQLLSIVLIYNIVIFDSYRKNIRSIIMMASVILLLSVLRFYLPFLILLSWLLSEIFLKLIQAKKAKKIVYILVFSLLTAIVSPLISQYFAAEISHFMNDFTNPVVGVFRFLMTPIPFFMDDKYAFLYFASFLHWLTFPLLVYGAYITYKVNKKVMLFILSYLLIMLLFYGSYSELQGPRHRLQIAPYLAMFQSIGFFALFYSQKFKKYLKKAL